MIVGQLDTDRAKGILDLQSRLERLDIRLIADPTDTAMAQQLTDVFAAIDTAVDSVRYHLGDDDQHDPDPSPEALDNRRTR